MVFVKFPRDEGNRPVEFKDMPKICQPIYFTEEGRIYKVTEITKTSQAGCEATILVRRGQ